MTQATDTTTEAQAPDAVGCRIAAFGECMVELTERGGNIRQGFGGDTLNTMLYLARLLPEERGAIAYLGALGDDVFSTNMLKSWETEGLCTDLVERLEGELPGLYYVRTDAAGDRSFYYWRGQSAVRKVMTPAYQQRVLDTLTALEVFYFSSVSLAILPAAGRRRLLAMAGRLRKNGARVVFDSNYRPLLWESRDEATRAYDEAMGVVDLAMVSWADERALFGDADAETSCDRIAGHGVTEIVVRNGAEPCLVAVGSHKEEFPLTIRVRPVDTTAAGDAFNAGYMAVRLNSGTTRDAVTMGNRLSSQVVQYPGAIIPMEKMPTLQEIE